MIQFDLIQYNLIQMETGYLISYDFRKFDLIRANDIEPLETINLFEVIREDDHFNIIKIYRNTCGNFNIGDSIFVDKVNGKIVYFNRDENGQVLNIDFNNFVIKKKSSIIFYSKEINDKINKIVEQMEKFQLLYPNSKYKSIIELNK